MLLFRLLVAAVVAKLVAVALQEVGQEPLLEVLQEPTPFGALRPLPAPQVKVFPVIPVPLQAFFALQASIVTAA